MSASSGRTRETESPAGIATGERLEAGCTWSAGLSAGSAAALGLLAALPRRGKLDRPERAVGGEFTSTWRGLMILGPGCWTWARADVFQRRDRQSLDAHCAGGCSPVLSQTNPQTSHTQQRLHSIAML